MDNRQNVRDWLIISTSVASIGVGLSAPIFLIPGSMIAAGVSGWLLWQSKGLPRKSDLVARQHREQWRQGLEVEFSEKSGELLTTVQQRDALVQKKAVELQQKEKGLIEWEQQLVTVEGKLTAALREQEQYYIQLLDEVEKGAFAEIQMRENSILMLQQKIMGLANRPDPKQGFAAWVAQLLLQGLEQNEVFCQLKGFYKIPGLREVSVWVELQTGTTAKKLENISKEVGTWVKMGEPTILWDADECVYEFRFAPEVDNYETSYEIVIDNESELPSIAEPDDPNWFINAVCDSKSVHFMIHGPSGGGKSVLVDNLMCVGGDELHIKTGKQVRIFIVDPKFPDSEWTYRGKRLKPQYRRWEQSVEGVLAMQAEVNDRLDVAAEAAEAIPQHLFEDPDYILPLPERDIDFWVVDEAAALHTLYKEQCSMAYRGVLWVGRSSLVRCILIGQNPNPSNYGLQIPDLNNCTRFYLGITALEALDRFIKPPREIKAKLKGQIYARLRMVKMKKLQGIAEPPEQYFALVVKANEPPFVAQLPPPKAYAYGDGETPLAEASVDITDLVERARVEELEQNLRDLLEYARQKETWVTGSEFRQNRNRYKPTQTEVINSWIEELVSCGFGECDRSSRTLKYRYPCVIHSTSEAQCIS
ncbi:MAG: hypothetical protein V7L26_11480 [Nostoc sp.]|uniref:hypothetical protein n=1 Tax=Nostoc sp. TaxID=1180 RepID=UPI002FF2EEBB